MANPQESSNPIGMMISDLNLSDNKNLTSPIIPFLFNDPRSPDIQFPNQISESQQMPTVSEDIQPNYMQLSPQTSFGGFRHRTRRWTPDEDERLIYAVNKYGTDNWQTIASIVGNDRNKAQCSQRWNRCKNPEISHKNWSKEEEEKLIDLVNLYGDKSWTRVSSELPGRTDVQCRFRYKFLFKKSKEHNDDVVKPISVEASLMTERPPIIPTITKVIEPIDNHPLLEDIHNLEDNIHELEVPFDIVSKNDPLSQYDPENDTKR